MLVPGKQKASPAEAAKEILFGIARNLLKSLESGEGIQGKPRKSNPVSLGMAWDGLVWLGPARSGCFGKRKIPSRFVLCGFRVLAKPSGCESVNSNGPVGEPTVLAAIVRKGLA